MLHYMEMKKISQKMNDELWMNLRGCLALARMESESMNALKKEEGNEVLKINCLNLNEISVPNQYGHE